MIRDAAALAVELAVLFFGVTFAVHLVRRRVGSERLQAWLGGPPALAALKGVAIGFVTPFCTFSAVPMLVGFRQAGVRTAGYVAFIVAAPVLDPVLLGAIALIAGLPAAAVYLAVVLAGAMTLALVADAVGIDRHLKPLPAALVAAGPSGPAQATAPVPSTSGPPAGACAAPGSEEPWQGLRAEAPAAVMAAMDLLRAVGVVLAVGVGLGILIEATVTPEMTAGLTGDDSLLSIPIAALLGTPLYFSTALFVPIADALAGAGVGLGAIVALTISGTGASVPEFLLLTRLATTRILLALFGYVLLVATIGGLLTQALTA